MKKNMKGITLVSLVITIIVMLILAGVSISMATGDNGVLTRASQGSVKTSLASVKEDFALAITSLQTDYMNDWSNEMSLESQKEKYFTFETVGNPATATNNYVANHKGINDYLTESKVICNAGGTAIANVDSTIKVTGPKAKAGGTAADNASFATLAGATGSGKNCKSASNDKTNCGYKLTPLYLSNAKKGAEIGGNLYVALYYVESGIPTIVDVGLVECTGTTFVSGADYMSQGTKNQAKVTLSDKKTAVTNITWLNNAEGPNT